MLETNNDEGFETGILYELLIHGEWQQEPELVGKGEKQDEKKGIVWNWLGSFTPPCGIRPIVHKLISQQMAWQFAVGGDGQVIAILQDQSIEIRSSRDDYSSIIGRCQIPRDPFPQWRKIQWSPDCSMLAVGFSNGDIEFFDLLGSNLFTIQQTKSKINSNTGGQDSSQTLAAMIFSEARIQSTQWSSEFLVVSYRGQLTSYFVSPTEGYQEGHTFWFNRHYPDGITSISYHSSHQMLIVTGIPQNSYGLSDTTKALHIGITAWRFLSDYPHYKLITSLEDEMDLAKRGWLHMVPFLKRYKKTNEQDLVIKSSISPSGQLLATVHISGALSLWHLPSLRPKTFYELQNQEGYNEINPQYCEPGNRRKVMYLNDPLRYNITDINWWSDMAIIVARYSGAVTVSSVATFKNLLGSAPEWFEVSPQVSACNDGGFLVLECESNISSKKRPLEGQDEYTVDESSDEEDSTYLTRSTQMMKRALYYITDSEKFQPPRKKPKILTRTYRLLCLKSTTPDELYTRKIDNEEYGEALALAKAYGLDCDMVYQRQWRKTPVSVASIQDYLSKITKRSWVLHECLERVSENIEASKELLLYGLRGTDLEALISIGRREDHGRFIVSQLEFDSDDEYFTNETEETFKRETKRCMLLQEVDFDSLNLEQKQLCQCRLKLFSYLDRLSTYEIILGGVLGAAENYNHNFFKEFRSQAGFKAALSFAQANEWQAVAAMFTYHGKETLPHRLVILSNFPETSSPSEYAALLPEANFESDDPEVYPWEEKRSREEDWCEKHFVSQMVSPSSNEFEAEYYEDHKEYWKYRTNYLTRDLLTQWYSERAREIESLSSLVENALDLIKLGRERNVPGLEKLHDDLLTMETLVYECHLDKPLSFRELEETTDDRKLQLLMSMSTESTFIRDVKQWLIPFLQRCEKYNPGSQRQLLKEYLVTLAANDLTNVLKIFENSHIDQPEPIITDIAELMTLALDCIYACKRDDQLSCAFGILECLPQRGYGHGDSELEKLHDKLDELEKHLGVAELLEQHNSPATLGYLYTCHDNAEEVRKLLIKLTRIASHRNPPLEEAEWKQLLNDMLDMQQKIYHCISPVDCYEIFVEALLCSGNLESISLAGRMIECESTDVPVSPTGQGYLIYHQKLDYNRAVKLVLSAAREYFNSSAKLSDPCMTLARECLQLIEDTPPSIEEESDLILSLPLLQEFSVNILPLQVRLCENRLELIRQALKSKPKAYKSSQKLLRLAYLLRVCNENKKEREGKVLSLIAEAAFQARDFQACYYNCQKLMAGGHEEGWSVCHRMGQCLDFKDVEARCKLLSFAIAHCSQELLLPLLQIRSNLKLQIIWDKIQFHLGFDEEEQENASSLDKDEVENSSEKESNKSLAKKGKTFQVLHSTGQVTKDVLTAVGSKQFWKDAVKWIQPLRLSAGNTASDEFASSNSNLLKQGVDAFYADIFEFAHISKFDADYTRYGRQDLPQSVEMQLNLLRAMLLKDTIEESENPHINSEMLLDLAKSMLSEDICYSLALLLTVTKETNMEAFFSELPSTTIVLHLATYYFALRLYEHLPKKVLDGIYTCDSITFINQMLIYTRKNSPLATDCEGFQRLLIKYNKLLFDSIQAEILQGLGGGVDIARFTDDDVYKKETILGLAMTFDESVLNVSLSLARHYCIPVWDIYMTNLQYMFMEESISTADIQAKVEQLKMLDELLSRPSQLKDKLCSDIYPSIDGKDHALLTFYYVLLDKCSNDPDITGIQPSTHLKILRKLKTVAPDLDYKMLTKLNGSPLSVIQPVLNDENVQIFAKLVTSLPDQDGGWLTSSSVYCMWAQKYFFEGSRHQKQEPKTLSDWLHRYESCGEYIQQLLPLDFLEFTNKIVFSHSSIKKLSLTCRMEITKRALKYCKQKLAKVKSETESLEWQNIIDRLQHNLQHLQRLDDGVIDSLWKSEESKVHEYAEEFDLSQSLPEKLQSMLLRAVFEGQSLSFIQTLLSLCPSEISWEPMDVYTEAIKFITKQLRNLITVLHPSLKNYNPMDVLQGILHQISENSDDLIGDDVVLELLRPFCSDTSVPVHIRLQVLQLLEKTTTLDVEDFELLLLFKTQAMVATSWDGLEITEEQVGSEVGRKTLFQYLLEASKTTDQLRTLANLLKCWPPLPDVNAQNPEVNLWVQLITLAVNSEESNSLNVAVDLMKEAMLINNLSSECSLSVYKYIEERKSLLHTLKAAILSGKSELQQRAIDIFKRHSQITTSDYDEELLSLVLHHKLTSSVVSTGLYQPLIEFLLVNQENSSFIRTDIIIKELESAGHIAEAGSLQLLSQGTHSSLSTFASALGIQKWFGKRNL